METYSTAFVCIMGIGTVFLGLIALILLTKLMSFLCKVPAPAPLPAAAPRGPGKVSPELVAAISAALAEELGTDITGIRILSIKELPQGNNQEGPV